MRLLISGNVKESLQGVAADAGLTWGADDGLSWPDRSVAVNSLDSLGEEGGQFFVGTPGKSASSPTATNFEGSSHQVLSTNLSLAAHGGKFQGEKLVTKS
jgi:hypothetical protein